jgi:hypothetical protein
VLTPDSPSVTVLSVAGWWFASSLGKSVELTHERREHILEYHADVLPYLDRLADVLAHPDELRRSLSDSETVLFYKHYPDIRSGKYMVAVVKVGEERCFVLTAYLTQTTRTGMPL